MDSSPQTVGRLHVRTQHARYDDEVTLSGGHPVALTQLPRRLRKSGSVHVIADTRRPVLGAEAELSTIRAGRGCLAWG